MTTKVIYLLIVSGVGLVAFFGWKLTARGSYESAGYTVIESEGEFEIREYPDLMLAKTEMQFEDQDGEGSFMRLFGYIIRGSR